MTSRRSASPSSFSIPSIPSANQGETLANWRPVPGSRREEAVLLLQRLLRLARRQVIAGFAENGPAELGILRAKEIDFDRMADLIEALDEWIRNGGTLVTLADAMA